MQKHRTQHESRVKPGAVKALSAAVALALTPAGASLADTHDDENPYAMDDRTWIDISGTVESVEANSFELDYGDGLVTVEMDDGDRDADGYQLLRGDTVSVSGMIDDDFFTSTSIEASTVFVENAGTTFYASSVDDEDMDSIPVNATPPLIVSDMVVRGRVSDVAVDSFVVDTGQRRFEVDVSELGYDPLDDDGYQRIEIGDRVKVSGEINRDLFFGRELVADTVTELYYGEPARSS